MEGIWDALVPLSLWQAALTLVGAGIAWSAITTARTPQGAVGWVVFLVSFPLIAIPGYLIFGRIGFRGYLRRRRAVETRTSPGPDATGPDWSRLATMDAISPFPVTLGNHPDLLIDGVETFPALFEAIEAARTEVLVQYYIVRADEIGWALHERLLAAASRGVRVRFLCDALGCLWLPRRYLRTLREGGVEAHVVHGPSRPVGRLGLNYRNHRKTVVVDGRVGFTGGINAAREYVDGGKFDAWRDTHLRVEGPVAWHLRESFADDWKWASHGVELPAGDLERPEEGDGLPALLVPTGPTDELERGSLLVCALIGLARRRLWIASPYLVPHTDLLTALQLAAKRGVDVRLLIPEKADHRLPWLAARDYLADLDQVGIEVHAYRPGFMHQKVFLVDDDVASIGTLNLDIRSVMLNFETSVLVEDEGFAARVEAMLERDFARARRLDTDPATMPLWLKAAAPVARLFAPVL
ncbi:cardiolipin synthase [Hasllibacter halocynthiae]|uniref:Cardiolipin synthase n=1 Tax=Hasllibacter halocynthiae TaxID=595589 RepID=A0A2T0X2H4_9RHOB|nr:cardiolipin synthase [Hasllibacter halocynthiae]PRY93138.1 cardiolipin synthase [Hasllibacter halocynthiae]